VMNRLLELDLPTVSGNEDRILVEVARNGSHSRTAAFCARYLEPAHIDWLSKLPLTLELYGAYLFHGTPTDDTQYLLTTVGETGAYPREPKAVEQFVLEHSQRLICCGHDHTPRIVVLASGCHIVNPGSIGCPAYVDHVPHEHSIESDSPHARYAAVEIQDDIISTELVKVSYDWEAAAQEAQINGFPDWAHWIATGRC
jgi:predicted phosphodiesterase